MSVTARIVCADAIDFLHAQEDDSIDLLFTSPPYELARTYGIGERMVGGEAWVSWMVAVVRAASPKVKGLIAINCEGQTRNYRYSAVPFLLAADLHRAGFNLRKPCVFHRIGIPGSGGPDWLRNDWEPIICVTRRGRLPYADNTACGHPPKFVPGGRMSYRNEDGIRKNERDHNETRQKRLAKYTANRRPNGSLEPWDYEPPVIANPGNVIKCNVGGGQMGHPAAHHNEAPFPLELPTFFVKSFAPPGGVVCDPFSGSGTTAEAAIANGRNFIGCDIRQSQVDLTTRRYRTVTPPLFSEAIA